MKVHPHPARAIRRGRLARILPALERAAAARCRSLYLVGGCVRDALLGRSLLDLDLVTEGDPMALARAVARRLGGTARRPTPFGTCRIDLDQGPRIDLAMARREIYSGPAALPTVSPAPVAEDLLRRDFTVNSMALALAGPGRGEILDPTGGMNDLLAGLLRLHHGRSLVDDPTRAFRAARYAARYDLRMAPGWGRALRAAARAGAFGRLGSSRLRRELERIWGEEDPSAALARAARWGLLRRIEGAVTWSPPVRDAIRRAAGSFAEREAATPLFFALLLRAAPASARGRLLARLGITGRPAERILAASGAAERFTAAAAKGRGGRAGEEVFTLIAAWDPLDADAARCSLPPGAGRRLRGAEMTWARAKPCLGAEDLISLGVPRGPRLGEVLHALRIARATGRLRTRARETALALSLTGRAP
jgi:tRNA nucleotidyltransferase (CCA-adding enzyme)